MKVGLISDIHGNLPALEAVFRELSAEGVNTVLCAGDIIGVLGWNNTVSSLIRMAADSVVFGNHDANVMPRFRGDGNPPLSIEYDTIKDDLFQSTVDWLCELPHKKEFTLGGVNTTLVHAHPHKKPHHGFPSTNFLNPSDYTKAGSDMKYSVVIHGHTHDQHALDLSKFDGLKGHIINPGSVGVPWYKPAEYAIVTYPEMDVELRTAEYDTERNEKKFREMDLDVWEKPPSDHKF